jgi:hypothetical protein
LKIVSIKKELKWRVDTMDYLRITKIAAYYPIIILLFMPTLLFGDSVVVSWDANTETDLLGYKVYYGTSSRSYDFVFDVGNMLEYKIDNLSLGITYFFSVTAYDMAYNESSYSAEVMVSLDSTSISTSSFPDIFMLYQNYPNPFNPVTTIPYYLPKSSKVKIRVLNPMGQTIQILEDKEQEAGFYKVTWDGKDLFGNVVASGVYFIRLELDSFSITRTTIYFK